MDTDFWSPIPRALWEDKELDMELLSWIPTLYQCLPTRLQSDPDILMVMRTSKPTWFSLWSRVVEIIPVDVQLEHPELVAHLLTNCNQSLQCKEAFCFSPDYRVPRDLWWNREVMSALLQLGVTPPDDVVQFYQSDRAVWLNLAKSGYHATELRNPFSRSL